MLDFIGLICFMFLCWRYQLWFYNKFDRPKVERMKERVAKRELEEVLIRRGII